MAMADYHDKHAWKNSRLRDIKPLWSGSRSYHDDRHNFHKAMRDGFAQKALSIDLHGDSGPSRGGFGMKESVVTPEEVLEWTGKSLEEIKQGKYLPESLLSRLVSLQEENGQTEAFGGIAPTGALSTINQNKPASSKVLQPKATTPLKPPPTSTSSLSNKLPTMQKEARQAVERASQGESISKILDGLLRF
jgi:hypothetical protein